jgi:hypothetical protein
MRVLTIIHNEHERAHAFDEKTVDEIIKHKFSWGGPYEINRYVPKELFDKVANALETLEAAFDNGKERRHKFKGPFSEGCEDICQQCALVEARQVLRDLGLKDDPQD